MTERKRGTSSTGATPRGVESGASGGLVKLFYRIGEVARVVGVAPHVLRYWESEFPTVRPQKSNRGQRVYTKRDVHKLLLIKHLLKEQGLTIAGARKQLRTQSTKLNQETEPPLGEALKDFVTGSSSLIAQEADAAPDRVMPEGTTLDGTVPEEAQSGLCVADALAARSEIEGARVELSEEGTRGLGLSAKSLRQSLLHVRNELVSWLPDLRG